MSWNLLLERTVIALVLTGLASKRCELETRKVNERTTYSRFKLLIQYIENFQVPVVLVTESELTDYMLLCRSDDIT